MPLHKQFLSDLISCHSTPGDEDEVASLLLDHWRANNWQCRSHGRYAISARSNIWQEDRPTLLISAHMDSPGFIVQSIRDDCAAAVSLGSIASANAAGASVLVKTATGKVPAQLEITLDDPELFLLYCQKPLARGDRACFTPEITLTPQGISAPFLDNRLGCHQLAVLASNFAPGAPGTKQQELNIVLAATAQEEFTGFGAAVLARSLAADLVICLDATYENPKQGVHLGQGPVLTLSDNSVLISKEQCECLQLLCQDWELPLQTEIYNFSGTDARAFPQQGLSVPVYPILLPSKGNHSPQEEASWADISALQSLLHNLCRDRSAVMALCSHSFS
jgi:putative aminopeptidase FrvX